MKKLENSNLNLEQSVELIKKEVELFDEIYCKPKREGVINLFVLEPVKEILSDRLNYLVHHTKETELISKLFSMGKLMGFDADEIVKQEEGGWADIDLSKRLPTKNNVPFFAWLPNEILNSYGDITDNMWLERSIGPIKNSGGLCSAEFNDTNTNYADDLVTHDYLGKTMSIHGLTFHKTRVIKGTDTRLSIDCGYHPMEGFMYSVSFHMKDKKVVSVTDGKTETDARSALDRLRDEISVSPQHILFYIENSNLSEYHKEELKTITDFLHSYPAAGTEYLFGKQEQAEPLTSKAKRFFTRKSYTPKDHSLITS